LILIGFAPSPGLMSMFTVISWIVVPGFSGILFPPVLMIMVSGFVGGVLKVNVLGSNDSV